MLAYAMSKAAMENMTLALARDLAGDGVTVNNLAPGYFHTLRNPQLDSAAGAPQGRRENPARTRRPSPATSAASPCSLCSDAGQYITGQTIYVDGGISAPLLTICSGPAQQGRVFFNLPALRASEPR